MWILAAMAWGGDGERGRELVRDTTVVGASALALSGVAAGLTFWSIDRGNWQGAWQPEVPLAVGAVGLVTAVTASGIGAASMARQRPAGLVPAGVAVLALGVGAASFASDDTFATFAVWAFAAPAAAAATVTSLAVNEHHAARLYVVPLAGAAPGSRADGAAFVVSGRF